MPPIPPHLNDGTNDDDPPSPEEIRLRDIARQDDPIVETANENESTEPELELEEAEEVQAMVDETMEIEFAANDSPTRELFGGGPNQRRPTIVYFDDAPQAMPPDRRSSIQANRRSSTDWNEMVTEHRNQAERIRTPSRGGTSAIPVFNAQNKNASGGVMIDGRFIPTVPTARAVESLTSRMYDKTTRKDLPADILQVYFKSATGYVLPKHNKLSAPDLYDTEGQLKSINNLGVQLRLIQRHLVEHDMIDVFTIVIPEDVTTSPKVTEFVSLFDAYPRLHPDIIANSNTWYHLWSDASYLAENLNWSYEMLRKNTEDGLWLKCQEDYDDYAPPQRGGPLMLFLILRRIQDVSETAIDHVKKSLTDLKISEIPGEDVDRVVSLIKSAHTLFKSASSSCHSYVPEDFPKLILKLFQTSSVPQFNQAFKHEQQIAQHLADKTGQIVEWPTVSELTLMATNSYKRLKASGTWTTPKANKRLALNATPGRPGAPRPAFTVKCWNCGEPHTLRDCPKPKDEAKIEQARKNFNKFRRDRRSAGSNNRGPPRPPRERAMFQGVPHVKNKLGIYVPDQRALRAERPSSNSNSQVTTNESPTPAGASAPARATQRVVNFAETVHSTTSKATTNLPTSAAGLMSALRRYDPRSGSV